MITKELSMGDAQSMLETLSRGETIDPGAHESEAGTGERLGMEVIGEAAEVLEELRTHYPSTLSRIDDLNAFDSKAAELLHRALPLDAVAAGNAGFWRWLAITKFYGLIQWRHGSESHLADFGNYGVTTRWRNYPAREWYRAQVSFDPNAADPYELSRAGHQDFWHSGILAPSYGSCRELVRALVKFQYPKDGDKPYLEPGDDGARVLYKKLTYVHANIAFEFLSEEQAAQLIDALAQGLPRE